MLAAVVATAGTRTASTVSGSETAPTWARHRAVAVAVRIEVRAHSDTQTRNQLLTTAGGNLTAIVMAETVEAVVQVDVAVDGIGAAAAAVAVAAAAAAADVAVAAAAAAAAVSADIAVARVGAMIVTEQNAAHANSARTQNHTVCSWLQWS